MMKNEARIKNIYFPHLSQKHELIIEIMIETHTKMPDMGGKLKDYWNSSMGVGLAKQTTIITAKQLKRHLVASSFIHIGATC